MVAVARGAAAASYMYASRDAGGRDPLKIVNQLMDGRLATMRIPGGVGDVGARYFEVADLFKLGSNYLDSILGFVRRSRHQFV